MVPKNFLLGQLKGSVFKKILARVNTKKLQFWKKNNAVFLAGLAGAGGKGAPEGPKKPAPRAEAAGAHKPWFLYFWALFLQSSFEYLKIMSCPAADALVSIKIEISKWLKVSQEIFTDVGDFVLLECHIFDVRCEFQQIAA